MDLKVKLRRLTLKNPVLTASGTFGYGNEYSKLTNVNKLGGIITKTITLKPKIGNKPCRIVETYGGMLNSIGLENIGLEEFIKQKLNQLWKIKTSVIASIAGSNPAEFVQLSKELDKIKLIKALELNLSCPNIHNENIVYGNSTEIVKETIRLVRESTDLPIITKLSPNVSNFMDLVLEADKSQTDAVSLVNTFIGMAVDINTRKPKIPNVTAGYSGPAIKPLALRYVWMVKKVSDVPIVGVGGIMNTADALEYIIAGASAVACGTVNFINPKAGTEIINGLENYLERNKIDSISKLIGSISC
ncbi:MAG: dihydroorotate dehydrogenase [bacterium]